MINITPLPAKQKVSQIDRERLVKIDKLPDIWTKQDTDETKQSPYHRADNHQQQQQQQQQQQ